MVRQFKSVEEFQRALLKKPQELMRFNVSPGWAVAMLEVSRSRISQMVNDGILDAVKTDDGVVLLRKAEIAAYKRMRDLVPKNQRAILGVCWKQGKEKREAGIRAKEDEVFSKFRASVTFPDVPTDSAKS